MTASPVPMSRRTWLAEQETLMASNVDARLKDLGITIPDAPAPAANYVPYTVSGNLVFVSGQVHGSGGRGVRNGAGSVACGKNGVNLDGCNLVGFNGLGIDANAHVLGGIAEAQSVFGAFLEQHWF